MGRRGPKPRDARVTGAGSLPVESSRTDDGRRELVAGPSSAVPGAVGSAGFLTLPRPEAEKSAHPLPAQPTTVPRAAAGGRGGEPGGRPDQRAASTWWVRGFDRVEAGIQ